MTSQQQQQRTRIALTSCDYFVGHETASHLLRNHRRELNNCQLVCVGVHLERMRDLERHGAEIVQINPDDINQMTAIFRGCECVVLEPIPENNRVHTTKRTMEAIKNANVRNVLLLSCAATESNDKWKHLGEFAEIERDFKHANFNWHCVLRTEFSQNWFHAWSYTVEDKGQFPLSTGRDRKFAPIRVDDVCYAIKEILRGDETCSLLGGNFKSVSGPNQHNRQTYTLTGPESLNGPRMVEELNRVIQGARVNYVDVDRNQMEQILRALRDEKRQQRVPRQQQPLQQQRATRQQNDEDDEDPRDQFDGQPTETQIQTTLDYFEYVKAGKADRTTDDLRKITGREGQRLEAFFRDNAAEFRPRRQE